MKPGTYVLVRGIGSGLTAGELVAKVGMHVTLRHARTIHYWNTQPGSPEYALNAIDVSVRGVARGKARLSLPTYAESDVDDAAHTIACSPEAERSIRSWDCAWNV